MVNHKKAHKSIWRGKEFQMALSSIGITLYPTYSRCLSSFDSPGDYKVYT